MSNNAQLPQSEGMYKLLLAASPDPIAIYNMSGEATYINRAFEETFGWSADELLGERIDFVPEANQEETSWAIQQIFGEAGRVQAMDTQRYMKNGSVIDVQLSASLFHDEEDEPAGIIVILRDMTSYKEAEAARQHSEERYHLILENIEDGYYEVDMKGVFTFGNDALETIFGWPKKDLIGSDYTLIMEEEMEKIVYEAFHHVYVTGAPNNGEDWRIIAKDGSIRHINSSIALIKNAQGKPVGCRGIVRDITEQRRAQEALRTSEERYRTIVESIQDGYYEIDLAGRHTFANAATVAIFGYSLDDLLGTSYKEYTDEETAANVYAVYNEVYVTGNSVQNYEYAITKQNGEKVSLGVSISLMRDSDGHGIGFRGLVRDITQRVVEEEKIKKAHDELETRVEERTFELLDLNASLTEEIAERTNAEVKLEQRNKVLENLGLLARETSFEMEIQPILETVARFAGEAIDATSVYVSTWDREKNTTTVQAAYFSPEASDKERVSDVGVVYSLDEDFPAANKWITDTMDYRISHVDDLNLPAEELEHFEEYGCKTDLTIPLIAKGAVIGLLEIWESRQRRDFTEDEIELAIGIGRQISVTFDNARLYQQALYEIEERERAETEILQNYEGEEVLNTLLQLSMEDAPLEDLLEKAFGVIISLSWFNALPKGSIFLVEDEPDVLVLTAKHYLDEPLQALCNRVPFGTCLCGKAATTGDIVFASCVDHDHETTFDGITEHGHYNVPIMIDDEVAGVLNLYLEHGHKKTDREITFLKAVAHTLSGLIRQKRADEALRTSQSKTRAIVDHALDAVVTIDNEAIVLDWNLQAEKTFGWKADEIVGQNLTDKIVPARYREGHTKGMARFLSTGERRVLNQRIEIEGLHKDGHEFPIELSISELAEGDSYIFSAFIRDITHRKEAEEALKSSEEKFRQLFEQSADAILLLGEGTFIDCNLATVAMMRATNKEEFLSVHPSKLSPPIQPDGRDSGEKADEMIQTAFEKGTHQFEWIHRRMDGEDFPVEVTLTVVPWEGKQALYTVWRDITERKQASDALRDSESNARLFQQKLQVLQEIGLELSYMDTLEEVYRQAVVLGRERLGYDRFGLLLRDEQSDEFVGTVGTDQHGEIVDESHVREIPSDVMIQAITGEKRAVFVDDIDITYLDNLVGHGWGAVAGIWDGDTAIGWLVIDNLLSQEPSSPYQLELLTLYGSTLGNLITRKRAAARLQASLDRRGEQMRLATTVAQEIAVLPTLTDLYDRVVELVKDQFGFYHVQLFLFDEGRGRVSLVSSSGEVGKKLLAERHALRLGVGLVGTAVSTGQSILRPDVSIDESWRANDHLPDTKGELVSLITLRGETLGVLDVQSDSTNALSADDEIIIGGLCGQIATAIDSINLAHETEMRLDELNALQQNRSRKGWDEQAEKYGSLGYQFDHTGLQAYTLIDPDGSIILDDNTTSTDDVETAVPPAIIADLAIRGQQFGIFGLEEDPDQPLTDEERKLFYQISDQVSEALEAARLFEQTQDSLAVQERLSAELGTVAEVSTAASTILEADKLLQVVVDLAKESFNLYHAHVYLLDDDAEQLVLQAGSGTVGRLMVLEGREISMESRSLVAQVARQKIPIIENRVSDVTNFLPHPLLPDTKSEMAVPLVVGTSLIGVLDLQSDQEGYFTDDDIEIQRTLSSQIAVSIQNARLYAEQVEAAKKLRQVDQLKSEFLASMSHELRTPLNSIIGFSDILLEGLDGELTERMDQDVRLIRGSGIHLRDLIGGILDMSKIEAGRMDLRYEDIDVVQVVGEIVATAKPLSDEKSLYLDLHIAPEVEIVEADRMRFRQIFYNIVSNSIKFTEKGGVTVDIRMNDENFLLVSVQDTGIGIKPEDVAVVFEQFRQIDGSLNRMASGTGLGMPITKNLVELHGGEIWIESTYGFGSTFLFTMPRYRVRKEKGDTGLLM